MCLASFIDYLWLWSFPETVHILPITHGRVPLLSDEAVRSISRRLYMHLILRSVGAFQLTGGIHSFCNIAKDEIPNLVHWNRFQLPSGLFVQVVPERWCNRYPSPTRECFTIENGKCRCGARDVQHFLSGFCLFPDMTCSSGSVLELLT